MTSNALPRVSGAIFPESWELPGKPEGASAVIQDAYRQTQFQLGGDLRLLREGMNLQLQVVKDSSASRFRTHALAASLMLWSRAFLGIGDAALLVTRGSYVSCPSIVRSACECIAAATQLRAEELPAFMAWLGTALQPDERYKALDVGMGQFFAGSTIAADPRFSTVYRAASELSRPHIGAGLALTALESNRTRLAVTFADQSFHFGWAQLVLGWLLALCEVQLRLLRTDAPDVFNIVPEVAAAIDEWTGRTDAALSGPARCSIEAVSDEAGTRWLLHNVRRQSSGAPKRLLL